MTDHDEKLRIAIEALLEVHWLNSDDPNYSDHIQRITKDALLAIRREHYLAAPSPVTAELLKASSL